VSDENWREETGPSPGIKRDDDKSAGSAWAERVPHSALTWALGIVSLLLALALCGLWALYLRPGRFGDEGPTPTAILWTVTPSPTATITPSPTAIASPEATAPGEVTPTASPDISVGSYVQVTGTGGYGLNLREGPGTTYPRAGLAAEGETFVVVEGPTVTGGAPWWKVRDLEDENQEWWAIGNYLIPIEQP
jgi:hypothetical protein